MASPRQKRKVKRVMREFKHGELKSGGRRKVKNRKQAIAIAMSESGQSRQRRGRKAKASNGRKTASNGRRTSRGRKKRSK